MCIRDRFTTKRGQITVKERNWRIRKLLNFSKRWNRSSMNIFRAVSYTHLDVYKRQGWSSSEIHFISKTSSIQSLRSGGKPNQIKGKWKISLSKLRILFLSRKVAIWKSGYSSYRSLNSKFSTPSYILINSKSVSYTHLDVYKRQFLHRLNAAFRV